VFVLISVGGEGPEADQRAGKQGNDVEAFVADLVADPQDLTAQADRVHTKIRR
jgi:hypothetical protein